MLFQQQHRDEYRRDCIEIPDGVFVTHYELEDMLERAYIEDLSGTINRARKELDTLMIEFSSSLSKLIEERADIIIEPEEIYSLYKDARKFVPA